LQAPKLFAADPSPVRSTRLRWQLPAAPPQSASLAHAPPFDQVDGAV
jgi:hypothetical protein